ncbi:MAG: GNAT family protein [Mycobacteriales bacterium]
MIDTPTLAGTHVRLEPMTRGSAAALLEAANADRSTYDLTRVADSVEEMQQYVDRALSDQAAGTVVPFVVVATSTGNVVGTTRFLDIECWPEPQWPQPTVVEIGHTWLARAVQRTAVNTEMKYLMLRHAFEHWGVLRVTLKTDARNERSRAAILRIGATFEGVRRVAVVASDGGVRDSAYFSIVADEWPSVERSLAAKLG